LPCCIFHRRPSYPPDLQLVPPPHRLSEHHDARCRICSWNCWIGWHRLALFFVRSRRLIL
jgi:hypothetical protein